MLKALILSALLTFPVADDVYQGKVNKNAKGELIFTTGKAKYLLMVDGPTRALMNKHGSAGRWKLEGPTIGSLGGKEPVLVVYIAEYDPEDIN